MNSDSLAARLADAPKAERDAILAELSDAEVERLSTDWRFWARPSQLPPDGDWTIWLILAGRGFGKTWVGANWINEQAHDNGLLALVGATAADVRDTMIEGPSGVLATAAKGWRPLYQPSKRALTWPNGAKAITYSGDEPERLRGPNIAKAWLDEWTAFKYPEEAYDMLMFTLRAGTRPQALFTQTPKPIPILRTVMKHEATVVTRGSTFENRDNLPETFFATVIDRYEGTRLGRQELYAEILEDVEGAFWKQAWIDATRVQQPPADLVRVVVAVDPAVTHGDDADETAITVAAKGADGDAYVLFSEGYRLSPDGWARRAVDLFDQYHADRVVAEVNQGGEMVEATLRQVRRGLPVKVIRASRGKTVRAEPVAALYEQKRVHHAGRFVDTEQQMCLFPVATDHDDRVDSLVYAITELMETPPPAGTSIDPEPSFGDRRRSFALGRR